MALLASSDQGLTVSRCERSGPVEICAGPEGPLFRLFPLDTGICVERRIAAASLLELACYAVFEDESIFLDWCDADTTRLSHPLLHRQLKQAGCVLLARGRSPTGSSDGPIETPEV